MDRTGFAAVAGPEAPPVELALPAAWVAAAAAAGTFPCTGYARSSVKSSRVTWVCSRAVAAIVYSFQLQEQPHTWVGPHGENFTAHKPMAPAHRLHEGGPLVAGVTQPPLGAGVTLEARRAGAGVFGAGVGAAAAEARARRAAGTGDNMGEPMAGTVVLEADCSGATSGSGADGAQLPRTQGTCPS